MAVVGSRGTIPYHNHQESETGVNQPRWFLFDTFGLVFSTLIYMFVLGLSRLVLHLCLDVVFQVVEPQFGPSIYITNV